MKTEKEIVKQIAKDLDRKVKEGESYIFEECCGQKLFYVVTLNVGEYGKPTELPTDVVFYCAKCGKMKGGVDVAVKKTKKISIQEATKIVKDYFGQMLGAGEVVAGKKLIDWLDFRLISALGKTDYYLIKCELKENIFSVTRLTYLIKVSYTGTIKEVKRVR